MKVYLVGGAVRDQLLGLDVCERDFVVVGASVEQMLGLGYRPVGKDFPVFLHPQTHEEYALARLERKVGKGYTGFDCIADPTVTLEEDLKRRDLTINAIAQAKDGTMVDPFGGVFDIEKKILRHVSPAFSEDPVRVLRLARFAARFADFEVDPKTQALCQSMVVAGEVDALVPERVWAEMHKALEYKTAWRFFAFLHETGALSRISQPLVIDQASIDRLKQALVFDAFTRLAILLAKESLETIQVWGRHWRCPKAWVKTLVALSRVYDLYSDDWCALDCWRLFKALDIFRYPNRLRIYLDVGQSLVPQVNHVYVKKILLAAWQAAEAVKSAPFLAQGLKGQALGDALIKAQVNAIEESLKKAL